MFEQKRSLSLMRGVFAVCRLDKDAPVPDWALGGPFFCVARTPDELSVVCEQSSVPEGIDREDGWRCLKVESPFDFDLTGVISSMAVRLAEEDTKMFVVATQDSDYLMVKQPDLGPTIRMLEETALRVDR
jgi:hypothetical protein